MGLLHHQPFEPVTRTANTRKIIGIEKNVNHQESNTIYKCVTVPLVSYAPLLIKYFNCKKYMKCFIVNFNLLIQTKNNSIYDLYGIQKKKFVTSILLCTQYKHNLSNPWG